MLDPDNPQGELQGNVNSVFQDFLQDLLRNDSTDNDWQLDNVRIAVESNVSQSASMKAPVLGPVSVYAEANFNLSYRDATTLLGTLRHGRLMFNGHTPGVAMDGDQLAELQKDGILHNDARRRGQINHEALLYTLGRMRGEWEALYRDEDFRKENLQMPDGSTMSYERYMMNIDTYLLSARESLYQGVEQQGNAQPRAQFEKQISIEQIRQSQQILEQHGLMDDDDAFSYEQYQQLMQPGQSTE